MWWSRGVVLICRGSECAGRGQGWQHLTTPAWKPFFASLIRFFVVWSRDRVWSGVDLAVLPKMWLQGAQSGVQWPRFVFILIRYIWRADIWTVPLYFNEKFYQRCTEEMITSSAGRWEFSGSSSSARWNAAWMFEFVNFDINRCWPLLLVSHIRLCFLHLRGVLYFSLGGGAAKAHGFFKCDPPHRYTLNKEMALVSS